MPPAQLLICGSGGWPSSDIAREHALSGLRIFFFRPASRGKAIAALADGRECVSLVLAQSTCRTRAYPGDRPRASVRQNRPRSSNAFPVFMRVEGEIVAVVGGGEEALAKARLIASRQRRIRIVADALEPALRAWIGESTEPSIIVSALCARASRRREAGVCRERRRGSRRAGCRPMRGGLACTSTRSTVPELCDFFTPALVNRAPGLRRHRHGGRSTGAVAADPRPHRPHAVAVAGCAGLAGRDLSRFGRAPAAQGRVCGGASGAISLQASRPAPWRSAISMRRVPQQPNC